MDDNGGTEITITATAENLNAGGETTEMENCCCCSSFVLTLTHTHPRFNCVLHKHISFSFILLFFV